jgi:CBS domain-containing protein
MQNFKNPSAINRHPLTATPDTLVKEAVALMSQMQSSYIVVLASLEPLSPLVGLFTEQDVVRLAAFGVDPTKVSLASVMTTALITIAESEAQDPVVVVGRFQQYGIHYLPVVGEGGNLVGLITPQSIRDLIKPMDLLRLKRVSEVMSTRVIHAPMTASVLELAQLMTRECLSCVVIVDGAEFSILSSQLVYSALNLKLPAGTATPTLQSLLYPVGIVTEDDIVQCCNLGLDLARTRAASVMSNPLLTVRPTDSMWTAHKIMQQYRTQRLVVLADTGELVGIITQTGIFETINPSESFQTLEALQYLVEEQTSQLNQLKKQLQIEIRKRRLVEQKLRSSESQMRTLFGVMTDLVLILHATKSKIESIEILPTNSSYLFEPGIDLVSEAVEQFFQDQTWFGKVRQALDTQQKLDFDYSLIFEERAVWFTASISPMTDDSAVWVARDITARKPANG